MADIFQIPYDEVFPVLALMSETKITSRLRMKREKVVNFAETELSIHEDMMPSLRENLKVLPFYRSRGFIPSRTVGFTDSDSLRTAKGVVESIDQGQTSQQFWQGLAVKSGYAGDLVGDMNKIIELEQQMVNYVEQNDLERGQDGFFQTPYDDEFLEVGHALEIFLSKTSHSARMGLPLTFAILKRNQTLTNQVLEEEGSEWLEDKSEEETYPLRIFIQLVATDLYPSENYHREDTVADEIEPYQSKEAIIAAIKDMNALSRVNGGDNSVLSILNQIGKNHDGSYQIPSYVNYVHVLDQYNQLET